MSDDTSKRQPGFTNLFGYYDRRKGIEQLKSR